MAEAVMVKLEELGVGAWLAQGDRVIRFDFCHFFSFSHRECLHRARLYLLCLFMA